MKNLLLIVFITALMACQSCMEKPGPDKVYSLIEKEFNCGNMSILPVLSDSLRSSWPDQKELIARTDSILQIAERICIDFSLDEQKVLKYLAQTIGGFSLEQKQEWEDNNWLEYRIIDGKKMYFNRAVSNLDLLKSFHEQRAERDSLEASGKWMQFRKRHAWSIIEASDENSKPVLPVEMKVKYTLTVQPDVVPEGEIIRCWLPWPKENNTRQRNIRFIDASVDNYIISPDTMIHRSIYLEKKAIINKPTVFTASFSYESYGQYFDPEKMIISPYDKSSVIYKEYTKEEPPHIVFSDRVMSLADSLAGPGDNSFQTVRKIYYWVNNNIPWAGALEYSIMPDIPGYVLSNMRGDCGMQTFLIMSMLRYLGIPVRWQSGWMVPPGNKNLHDWCEVYFEGLGWIPLDMSYGLHYSIGERVKEFYISGIDSYRLIVNDGVSGAFHPVKKYLRSEPYDFQRGEVEWSGGNLYFDKWDYEMEIEYK